MVTGRRILLARPHPFVVETMQPFLAANGWTPEMLADVGDIVRLGQAGYAGSIISTAPHASVRQTFLEVFEALRRRLPTLPIAFSTLLGWDLIAKELRIQVSRTVVTPEILRVSSDSLASPALGTTHGILVIRKEDLTDPSAATLTARILRRHFAVKRSADGHQ